MSEGPPPPPQEIDSPSEFGATFAVPMVQVAESMPHLLDQFAWSLNLSLYPLSIAPFQVFLEVADSWPVIAQLKPPVGLFKQK